MKTGRLLKFHRPGGDLHAYIYRDGSGFKAAVYLMGAGAPDTPAHVVTGPSEAEVEVELRAWVEVTHPRSR